jgi:hypothetical protein
MDRMKLCLWGFPEERYSAVFLQLVRSAAGRIQAQAFERMGRIRHLKDKWF